MTLVPRYLAAAQPFHSVVQKACRCVEDATWPRARFTFMLLVLHVPRLRVIERCLSNGELSMFLPVMRDQHDACSFQRIHALHKDQ